MDSLIIPKLVETEVPVEVVEIVWKGMLPAEVVAETPVKGSPSCLVNVVILDTEELPDNAREIAPVTNPGGPVVTELEPRASDLVTTKVVGVNVELTTVIVVGIFKATSWVVPILVTAETPVRPTVTLRPANRL